MNEILFITILPIKTKQIINTNELKKKTKKKTNTKFPKLISSYIENYDKRKSQAYTYKYTDVSNCKFKYVCAFHMKKLENYANILGKSCAYCLNFELPSKLQFSCNIHIFLHFLSKVYLLLFSIG